MSQRLTGVDFPTLGYDIIDWIETYLVHGPGDVSGEPIEIDDEMALFICWAYRVVPKGKWEHGVSQGRRVFRRAVLSRPKGRAKSELAGMLACAEALAPVRFDGWDANGDPVGKPIRSPFIRCLATEEEQTGNTYDNVVAMLTEGEAANEYAVDVGLTKTYIKESGGGEITPSTSASASKDGGKETFAVADETHLYVPAELRKMHAVVRRNTGKRKAADPWMLDTTTMFRPGEKSVAERTYAEHGELTVKQMVKAGLLYDHREAPKVEDLDDDREVLAALKDVYGPFAKNLDLRRVLKEMRDEEDPADGIRYWLNQPVKAASQWLSPDQWGACKDVDAEVDVRARITLGFDGSKTKDATALVGCVLTGHLFLIKAWERPEGEAARGWEVPRDEVQAEVESAMDLYDVERFYCDPFYWHSEVSEWYAEWPEAVSEWGTHRDLPMAAAIQRLEMDVLGQHVTHDGDELLARHVSNAHVYRKRAKTEENERKELRLIRKESRDSPKKIDAAVAAILAYEARADAIEDGALSRVAVSKVPWSR